MHKQRWVIASGNQGKLKEFRRLFSTLDIELIPQSDLNVVEAEETGLSFIENAILKARNAASQTGMPAIADDSGLEVRALNGEPGIYSARYSRDVAGDQLSDESNNRKLLAKLEDVSDRRARFVCALAKVNHASDPTPLVCVEYWEGEILSAPAGVQGFGYDPLFFVPQRGCSAAELAPEDKARISHRGQAMKSFVKLIDKEFSS